MDEQSEKESKRQWTEICRRVGQQAIILICSGILGMIFLYYLGRGISSDDEIEMAWAGIASGVMIMYSLLAWLKYRVILKEASRLSRRR